MRLSIPRLAAVVAGLFFYIAEPSVAQNLLFHLLPHSITVGFSTSSQSISESSAALPWAPTYAGWSKRIGLYLGHGGINQGLTDFPLMVKLNSGRVSYADFKAGGADVRFADSNGTALSYEIESWNTSGESILWVKVPSIPANSTPRIYLYYGNPSASDGQTVAATWSGGGYKGVYHFNTCGADSAGAHTATCNSATSVTGRLGSGMSLTGALGSNMNIPKHADFDFGTGDFTLALWVKPAATYAIKTAFIDNSDGTNGMRFIVSDTATDTAKLVRGGFFADGTSSTSGSGASGERLVWM